jgi:hypothetical protein
MGSDTANFVFRMLLFAATFYFLAEFALVSNVPTPIAMTVLVAIVTIIIAYTVMHRSKRLVKCQACKRQHIA